MCIRKYIYSIILSLAGTIPINAQRELTEICIDFRVGSMVIDSRYRDNGVRLDEIVRHISQLRQDTTRSIIQITFSGIASPEGNHQLNKQLADGRLSALEKYVRSHIDLPEDFIIRHDDTHIPWSYLIAEVEMSDISHKDELLAILRSPSELVPYSNNSTIDSRVPALQKLGNGQVWRLLNERFFPQMRNACFVLITRRNASQLLPVGTDKPSLSETVGAMDIPVLEPAGTVGMPEEPARPVYLKTNAVGWGMLIANIAVEADLARHWSVTLPVYYSALNYFTSDVKFRTMCLQPEARYWFRGENTGWFAGAHFGVAWFNYAKGGEWRYQDHNRRTPLIGGGISGGYRLPISRDRHWWMEFSLGTGAYRLHYDIFHNGHNGQRVDTRKRTFFGIDRVAVSFAYRLDLKKKGGRR